MQTLILTQNFILNQVELESEPECWLLGRANLVQREVVQPILQKS